MQETINQLQQIIEAHQKLLGLFLPHEECGKAWIQGFLEGLKCAISELEKH